MKVLWIMTAILVAFALGFITCVVMIQTQAFCRDLGTCGPT